jgi:thiamine-phosphate pyrophosphorylase
LLAEAKSYYPKILSASFHGWEEIRETENQFDYLFISPVFDSISKKGYEACIDLEQAIGVKKQLGFTKIVGLGGVAANNLASLEDYGLDGAALLGTIWQSANPEKAFEAVVQALNKG